MSSDKSFVGQVEQNVDDLAKVRRRRPWLFYLLVLGFLVVGGLYVFEKFWGIPKLKETISNQKDEIAELKRDRDAKASQLAPFLAVANRQFQDLTETERLNKLLRQIEEATFQMKRASDALPKPRKIESEQAEKIVALLKQAGKGKVDLTYDSFHRDAEKFAQQLKALFESGGWSVAGPTGKAFQWEGRSPSLLISVRERPTASLEKALVELLDALGLKEAIELNPNLPSDTIGIYVGEP